VLHLCANRLAAAEENISIQNIHN